MAATARKVQVSTDLSKELAAGARALAKDAVRKIDAGSALIHAIYHHPKAVDLIESDFWTLGLQKAYAQACAAYGIGRVPRDEEGDIIAPAVDPQPESGGDS